MTSRERVRAALEHRPIDRVPLSMTFSVGAYNNIVRKLDCGLRETNKCSVWMLTFPEPDFIRQVGSDCIYLPINGPGKQPKFELGCDEYTTEFGLTFRKRELANGILDYEPCNAPLEGMETTDLERYNWPDPADEAMYANLEARGKELYENTDLAIVGYFGGSMFTLASMLRGTESWLVDLLIDVEFVDALFDRLCGYYKSVYCTALEKCGRYLEYIRVDNDDYGTQNGLLISRDLFRKVIKPHVADFYTTVKKKFQEVNPHGKLMKHSCGDVYDLVDDFIDMGIDILDPVQPRTKGMTADKLMKQYGGKISFHGAIDTQYVLSQGTPQDVDTAVRQAIEGFAMPGGYIVSPAHHLQPDVSADNILALRDAAFRYGAVEDGELIRI